MSEREPTLVELLEFEAHALETRAGTMVDAPIASAGLRGRAGRLRAAAARLREEMTDAAEPSVTPQLRMCRREILKTLTRVNGGPIRGDGKR